MHRCEFCNGLLDTVVSAALEHLRGVVTLEDFELAEVRNAIEASIKEYYDELAKNHPEVEGVEQVTEKEIRNGGK